MARGEADWGGGLGAHPSPGDQVGPYRILELLGSGGMASVYRAADDRGAPVAVKVLNPARVLAEDVKRFTREYKALSRMDHENVVKVYEAGVHEGYPWIAMELVEGTDLETEIERWRRDDPADRFERIDKVLRGLCRGLAYVHDIGLVHRDLKPSNVLLTREGEPKISDFGVVKGDNTASTQLTMAGRLVGTVAFMAPELITDELVDRRADLYALGAVLYVMVTFRRPIEADSVAGYLARHLTEVPRPMGELEPAVPQALERLAQRLLQKDKAWRYPNAQAVLQALDRSGDPEIPPLRGRDAIQQRWTRALLQLTEGAGAAIALRGPAGSGKTHLLRALQEQVTSHGLRLEELTGSVGSPSPGEPVVLAADDLDRADPGVVRELARLLRQHVTLEARPLLLVFTATEATGELAALIGGASTGLPCDVVEVGPVDPKSAVAMVRDRGVTGPLAAALGRRLQALYGGIPGAMVQQLEALVAEGWLDDVGDQLKPARPIEDFRKADLPVPEVVRRRVRQAVSELDDAARELVELMALLDRPASAALVERCRPDDPNTPRLLDELVRLRILARTTSEHQEVLELADPCAARVVRAGLDPRHQRKLHARLAKALMVRRRRANALEVAEHLRASGDVANAWPLYVQAARRAARDGRFSEVIEICDSAEQIREQSEPGFEARERLRLRRWLFLLRGEALLARRGWADAVAPLEAAVACARLEGDAGAVSRCLGSLGRAHYRMGRFDEAAPLLREALEHAEHGAPERASATRALADIEMRLGRVEQAEGLWKEALRVSMDIGSRDAEARARRGLAHLRAIQGQLGESGELLTQADDLLNPDGDYRVRAGVLARAVELDTAAGRLGSALYRAELLVELARRHGMGDRLPEAYGLLAAILVALGDSDEARDAAHQALVFARAAQTPGWEPRVRAARALADLGYPTEASEALPDPEDLPPSQVYDPAAQAAALRARLCAAEDPSRARDLAAWALTRPQPLLVLAGARISLDAALALIAAGQIEASRQAVKRGLKVLQVGSASDGLRLELLVAMQTASPDPRVIDALKQVAGRMLPLLPPHTADRFRARPVVRDALRQL